MDLHRELNEKQAAAGARVISLPHALGFLDRGLSSLRRRRSPQSGSEI
jgi:hypothetical protein